MSDYDIHSCGYYCDRSACIERQRNELRDKLFEEIRTSERNIQTSDKETLESLQPWVKTYSGGKPNYTQPIEPTIDGWPLWSGLPLPPDNFIDAVRYSTAISQGEQRIDPASIYKEPEPVAYINVEERKLEWATPIKWETPTVVKMDKIPLYTASPQHESAPTKLMIVPALLEHAGYVKKKEWVGLTDEEYTELWGKKPDLLNFFRKIEAKLKEKNNA